MDGKTVLLIGVAAALAFAGGEDEAQAKAAKKKKGFKKPDNGGDKPPTNVDEPDEPGEPTPRTAYEDTIQEEPTVGALYRVRKGDSLVKVAATALGVSAKSGAANAYAKALSASRWNWALYAVHRTGPYSYMWPGTDIRGQVDAAFLPGNDSVRAAAIAGELPFRRYRFAREKNPNTMLWPTASVIPTAGRHGTKLGYGTLYLRDPDDAYGPDEDEANPMELLAAFGIANAAQLGGLIVTGAS